MPRSIIVIDERFGRAKEIGRHENVPDAWGLRDIQERFGIRDHLSIYEELSPGVRDLVHQGRRSP